MRFAFLGKGGSGKTTVTAGFVHYLLDRCHHVVAIDADVNVHLAQALGLNCSDAGPYLADLADELRIELRGTRGDLGTRPLLGTTPPARGSRLVRALQSDEILRRFSLQVANLSLVRVGNYGEEDIGDSCYHSKLSSLASLLHHLADGEHDFVVADTTAGTDNVATSLAFAYDVNIFVVEPTTKSVAVYRDFLDIASPLHNSTYVIGNKIEDEADEAFVSRHVGRDKYLGSVPFSRAVKRFEQGEVDDLKAFQAQLEPLMERIVSTGKHHKRNWSQYLAQLRRVHGNVATEWANAMYGHDLVVDLDQGFSYEAAIAEIGPTERSLAFAN